MKSFFAGPLPDNARNLMRRLGYGEQRTYAGQVSYNRLISNSPFPKFHAYVDEKDGGIQINLHFDQTGAGGDFGREHRGEYEGPLVEREMARIGAAINAFANQANAGKEDNGPGYASAPAKKGGFWGGLFG